MISLRVQSLLYVSLLVLRPYSLQARVQVRPQCHETLTATKEARPQCPETLTATKTVDISQQLVAHTKFESHPLYESNQHPQNGLLILKRNLGLVYELYAMLLKNKPLSTKSTTAAVLSYAGDAIAQRVTVEGKYDIKRAIFFMVFGGLYTGLFQHFWFGYLNSKFASDIAESSRKVSDLKYESVQRTALDLPPPSRTTIAVIKLLINQFALVPFFYMPLFLVTTSILKNLNLKECLERCQALFFPLLKRNYLFWLPIQFVQFLVIPDSFQITFLSIAGLLWTVILSSLGGG